MNGIAKHIRTVTCE